jgi:PAS domain S-box-containing protein
MFHRESDSGLSNAIARELKDYAVFLLDTDGHVVTWNEGARLIKGYEADEIIGRHFSAFYTEDDCARGKPQLEMRSAATHGRYEDEGWRVRKGGERFWCNEVITARHDEKGRLVGFLKVARDLTERKRVEDQLRESEERHRLLVENVRDYAVFMVDPEGRVMTWNPGAQRVFGYVEEEIVGRSGSILFTAEDLAAGEHDRELATALSEGRASDDRWQVRKGGERFWASGVTMLMRDDAGGLRGFVKVCRDLTEKRQAEEQRDRLLDQEKLARWEAEKAMAVRDEFLAVVSHELRTPLTAILLWGRLLRAGAVSERDREAALDAIEQSAAAQRQLIEDLLDISRITSGKMRLNVHAVDLVPVLQAAVDAVRPMAEARGVRIETDLPPGAGDARADPDRVQQIVWNLVNNAVKFTAQGGTVSVRLERQADRVRVVVSDTGRGISAEFLPQVFEVFRQADASLTREQGGLGLGLSISKRLAELHGGTLHAESAGEGRGATFTLELPLAAVLLDTNPASFAAMTAERAMPFSPAPVLAGRRVLLVEDEAHTRAVVQWLLEQCAAEVTAVGSAAQALDALRNPPHAGAFHALVSDIAMPGEDGYVLIRQVRSLPPEYGTASSIPAVALTAYARQEDRARALAAGFQAHVPKPVEPDVLIAAVGALVTRQPPCD